MPAAAVLHSTHTHFSLEIRQPSARGRSVGAPTHHQRAAGLPRAHTLCAADACVAGGGPAGTVAVTSRACKAPTHTLRVSTARLPTPSPLTPTPTHTHTCVPPPPSCWPAALPFSPPFSLWPAAGDPVHPLVRGGLLAVRGRRAARQPEARQHAQHGKRHRRRHTGACAQSFRFMWCGVVWCSEGRGAAHLLGCWTGGAYWGGGVVVVG